MKIQWFYSSLGNFFKNASRTLLEDIFSIYQLNENGLQWISSKYNINSWILLDNEIAIKSESGESSVLGGGGAVAAK